MKAVSIDSYRVLCGSLNKTILCYSHTNSSLQTCNKLKYTMSKMETHFFSLFWSSYTATISDMDIFFNGSIRRKKIDNTTVYYFQKQTLFWYFKYVTVLEEKSHENNSLHKQIITSVHITKSLSKFHADCFLHFYLKWNGKGSVSL